MGSKMIIKIAEKEIFERGSTGDPAAFKDLVKTWVEAIERIVDNADLQRLLTDFNAVAIHHRMSPLGTVEVEVPTEKAAQLIDAIGQQFPDLMVMMIKPGGEPVLFN